MKKLAAIFALTLASTSVMASGLNLDVQPAEGGAWVSVTEQGQAVKGAKVTSSKSMDSKVTDESGRVFIYSQDQNSGSVTYVANTDQGQQAEKAAFVAGDRS
ncbi:MULTISPECIES: hypothetical protein [Salinivibrio]|uniref:hypothetical protein n=1 Tax=Salinivibrio TaxID=51366 RepID=UPI0009858C97|nr:MULTISPECIES: hypothetical protein [Salinivibrio]OOF15654.1 hypothetical protein BZG84_11795 [Salinivibrio sp. PR932]OOF16111.1 hypothetical protein BZG83_01815 [Salinivibrio sp. PR919]OOF32386.1 hypothetical protein BZJ20_00750 [Salinivibrio proteolyticus]PCE66808.1 hypothetical protein B6G00_00010 [Salinivibrio sp. YCSC6]QCF36293.1 hypothetical protein E8E00_08975 [Salinivibrio sp. YCSC6]